MFNFREESKLVFMFRFFFLLELRGRMNGIFYYDIMGAFEWEESI